MKSAQEIYLFNVKNSSLKALQWMTSKDFSHILFEMDCKEVVHKVNTIDIDSIFFIKLSFIEISFFKCNYVIIFYRI